MSNENVDEKIRANDHTFRSSGERYDGLSKIVIELKEGRNHFKAVGVIYKLRDNIADIKALVIVARGIKCSPVSVTITSST